MVRYFEPLPLQSESEPRVHTNKKCSNYFLLLYSILSKLLASHPWITTAFWSYMSEKYQIFEHFNPSCKHFSVAKYFTPNGTTHTSEKGEKWC